MKDRSSGIDCIGSVPWGTHICQFYQSKNDLIDILVPYFKAGLENNEYCIWATSDPLGTDESLMELGMAVPNLRHYLDRNQLMVTDAKTSYAGQGKFDASISLQGLIEMEQFALKHGFDGLRASSNTLWLTKEQWTTFVDYDLAADLMVRRHKIIALCSYPLDGSKPADIIHVVCGHRLILIRETDGWRLLQNNSNAHLIALRDSGLTYREIGQRLGLTKQRIAKLLSPNTRLGGMSINRKRSPSRHGLLSTIDAAEFLGVHPNTIRQWSDDGQIAVYRVGKRLDRRFRRTDLKKFLKTNR